MDTLTIKDSHLIRCDARAGGVVVIPDDVQVIDEYAFSCCYAVREVYIPDSVYEIGDGAFFGCNSLKSVHIPKSVMRIGRKAFCTGSGLECISVHPSNPVYDSRMGCNALIETFTDTLIAGAKMTVIPESVERIGPYAFSERDMESIEIPSSVVKIGDHAFQYCAKLKSLVIPSSVRYIGKGITKWCVHLKTLKVDSENPVYDSREDCNAIVETATDTVIAGCNTTVLCDGITAIGDNAFEGLCFDVLPMNNTVKKIGAGAFSNCRELAYAALPKSLEELGEGAFDYCSELGYLEVPKSVRINGHAFREVGGCVDFDKRLEWTFGDPITGMKVINLDEE